MLVCICIDPTTWEKQMKIFAAFLAFLKRCFGGSSAGKNPTKTPLQMEAELNGEVNSIALHPSLVKNLKLDHQNLLNLYTKIITDTKDQKYSTIVGQLQKFKSEFSSHLNTENIKFYGYLEQQLEQGTQELKEMREYRKNMRGIERAVNKFLDTWIESGVDATTAIQFHEEANQIAGALVARIESEESTLYPIYDAQVPTPAV